MTIALLFHDIANGRDEDHSIAGAKIVKKFSKRFNLSAYELETISWLVREHLIMSFFSQTRDVMDAKTVADFSLKVQTPERLKFLFILTIADISAVGPGSGMHTKVSCLNSFIKRHMQNYQVRFWMRIGH